MKEDAILVSRLKELANCAYTENRYTFTSFLSEGDLSMFYEIEKELSFVSYSIYGGYSDSERVVVRFGDEEQMGYSVEYPISIVHCEPLSKKFAEKLGHRDVLGSLMNLGIEREIIGDILVHDKECYFFCLDKMSKYIVENLVKIRHTLVKCELVEKLPIEAKKTIKEEMHIVASSRNDCVVAAAYKLSRSQAVNLFREKKIFVNGRLCENISGDLFPGDLISVRGYGKFSLVSFNGETKKGKIKVVIGKYI